MKEHERIFFALCFNLWLINPNFRPRTVVNILADTIPHKRCWYYLSKWAGLGFYDYGITLDLGWFDFTKMPERYRELVQKNERGATANE